MTPSERAAVDQAHRQFGEPTATPKPRAGEHTFTDAAIAHAKELDALREALGWILPLAEAYLKAAPYHPDNAKLESARILLIKHGR